MTNIVKEKKDTWTKTRKLCLLISHITSAFLMFRTFPFHLNIADQKVYQLFSWKRIYSFCRCIPVPHNFLQNYFHHSNEKIPQHHPPQKYKHKFIELKAFVFSLKFSATYVAYNHSSYKSSPPTPAAEREKVRQRGSSAESWARALRADQGLYILVPSLFRSLVI